MRRWILVLVCLFLSAAYGEDSLRVPAFTAYLDPNPRGASVSEHSGVTRFRDPATRVLWFGEFKTTGNVECSVELRLPQNTTSSLRLTVGENSREATVTGDAAGKAVAKFGTFAMASPGYVRFALESLNAGRPVGDVDALIISGPPTKDAHFNLKPRRNAASVHLHYPVPQGMKVAAFYCEVTGIEDPPATYYEACGWHRGYFGMQVNSPTERRIIFSVWDSGGEAVSRAKVADADRVRLVARGEGVVSGDFGNEGTGGHSHLVYNWKTGQGQKFVVTARPVDATHTVFSGYYFHPDKRKWVLISSWNAPKEGGYMRGLYSFNEDFDGANGHLRRKALFGNQWVRDPQGRWTELTDATFTCDGTGKVDRPDRFAGVENGAFFLSNGGFVPGFLEAGTKLTRNAGWTPPGDLKLPPE
jgi:uncharacterized protein DUF3472/uncharacterized protein DUF5077